MQMEQHERLQLFMSNLNSFVEMFKEKTHLCNDSHEIKPFSNPSDLYFLILRWQLHELIGISKKMLSYSHERELQGV